jgi:hypothetical protein
MTKAIIKDRLTHVFLFNYDEDPDAKPGVFRLIGQSHLRELVTSAAASTAGPLTPPGQPAPAPAGGAGSAPIGRDAWTPLGAGGQPQQAAAPGGGGLGSLRPGALGGGGAGRGFNQPGGDPNAPAGKGIKRFEFVIMFFWREPTPSEQLMNLGAAPR